MKEYWDKLGRFGKDVEVARALAEGFLAAHPKEDLYPVTFEDADANIEMTVLVRLSDEELDRLRELAEECEDPWTEYPELVSRLVDEEAPDVNPGNCWDVTSVSLAPKHSYLFTMVVFEDGPDKSPKKERIYVSLSDAEYAAILAWRFLYAQMGEGNICFNMMRQDLPELFDKISTNLEFAYGHNLFRIIDYPYAVFMDDVDKDLAAMKKGA